MSVAFGIDRLLADPALRRELAGRRVALLARQPEIGITNLLLATRPEPADATAKP